MGSQHPSPNVKTLCNFEPQIWLDIITSRDAESACFKLSRTSCREIIFGIFWPNFGQKRSHHVMDASCRPTLSRHFSAITGAFEALEGEFQKGLEVCYCLWGVPSRPSPGSYPGPVQVPSRVRGGPVQIRHLLCFTVFRTHPGPEVGAIPPRPGPILLPSVPHRIGPGQAETDFLAICENWPVQESREQKKSENKGKT